MVDTPMAGKVYLNGRIVDPHEASVGILDRGFLYGDSVFETLRAYQSQPFECAAHLERFQASAQQIGLSLPWSTSFLQRALAQTLEASGLSHAYLRLIASRGTGALGLSPALARDPLLVILVLPLPNFPDAMYQQGCAAWIVHVRRNPADAIPPQAKTGNYLNNILALQEAQAHGADEAIMLNHEGWVTEASSANVFAYSQGTWKTPPIEAGLLKGITRQTLLRLGTQAGIPMREEGLTASALQQAQELLVCGSVREVVPMVRLNDQPMGDGKVGAQTQKLMALYRLETQRCTNKDQLSI